ncbi:MAG: class I SAM-dependent methyltransferase [Archaeoglobus sp.]|uniref:class I SAM-dependent methyltransferase n=1 Tax=Archaeoglobus sp. TaxID=1872626 RepID=UPI001DB33E78|nr:class I SAM-dependent methyltransferase [Archaeoglobus sp.]MBO8180931.1 class I SAM-dependent methyltransferase [Archaeoglobus sp.]
MGSNKKNALGDYYDIKFKKEYYGKEAVFLSSDPNHYHQKILKIIEELSQDKPLRILDVGCATGYLGAATKKGKNYVCGVEISKEAAKEAKNKLDDVVVGNIEEIELPYPKEYFDVIICSDVVEHLFNPKETLIKLRSYLKPNGKLLMVVPNVAWYRVRLMLLTGKWEYKEHGIMDYGHIRWFTKESGVRLLKESGYDVEEIIPYIVLPSPLSFVDHIFMKLLSKVSSKFFDTIFSQAFLYVGRKGE